MKSVQATHRPWTDAEVGELRAAYAAGTTGDRLPLATLAQRLGRDKANVCRKARGLGLTNQARPKKAQPKLFLWGARHAPDQLSAVRSEIVRQRWQRRPHPRGFLGHTHTEETRRGLSESSARSWANCKTEEERQDRVARTLATRIERYGSGSAALHSERSYSRTRHGRREDLPGIRFRSAWEANYARYLNFLIGKGIILEWAYEPRTFTFPNPIRVASYTPDFRIVERNGWVRWHEVKGQWTRRFFRQLTLMKRYHPAEEIVIVDTSDYRELDKMYRDQLPGWEGRQAS